MAHPLVPINLQSLIKSFRQASTLAVQHLKELAISLEGKPLEEKKDLLKKCAMTTLNSKLVSVTANASEGAQLFVDGAGLRHAWVGTH